MGYPITLTISPGHSGTKFLYSTFMKNCSEKGTLSHELLKSHITKPAIFFRCYQKSRQIEMMNHPEIRALLTMWRASAKFGPVVDFGWTMSSLVPAFYNEFGDQLRVLVIHRHPILFAASACVGGAYSEYKSESHTLSPMYSGARYKEFKDRWKTMTPFEKCLYRWLEVTAYGFEVKEIYPNLNHLIVKSDDIFSSDKTLEEIAQFLGLKLVQKIERSNDANPASIFSIEQRPIKDEWRNYKSHPKIIQLGEKLGYDLEKRCVEKIIRKYQLPSGILPFLRHKSGYWRLKSSIGNMLRAWGLRK